MICYLKREATSRCRSSTRRIWHAARERWSVNKFAAENTTRCNILRFIEPDVTRQHNNSMEFKWGSYTLLYTNIDPLTSKSDRGILCVFLSRHRICSNFLFFVKMVTFCYIFSYRAPCYYLMKIRKYFIKKCVKL